MSAIQDPILNPSLDKKFKLISKFQKVHVGGFGTVDFSTISEARAEQLCIERPGKYLEKIVAKEDPTKAAVKAEVEKK